MCPQLLNGQNNEATTHNLNGRFLQKNKTNMLYFDIGDKKATTKNRIAMNKPKMPTK
jgi:hypothetical protein